jgi:hypothetical protein
MRSLYLNHSPAINHTLENSLEKTVDVETGCATPTLMIKTPAKEISCNISLMCKVLPPRVGPGILYHLTLPNKNLSAPCLEREVFCIFLRLLCTFRNMVEFYSSIRSNSQQGLQEETQFSGSHRQYRPQFITTVRQGT